MKGLWSKRLQKIREANLRELEASPRCADCGHTEAYHVGGYPVGAGSYTINYCTGDSLPMCPCKEFKS